MSLLSQKVHQFANALETRQRVDVIYLDFSKAFDRDRMILRNSRLFFCLHKPINGHKSARGPHRRDVTHILSKVSCFLLKSFHFRRLEKR